MLGEALQITRLVKFIGTIDMVYILYLIAAKKDVIVKAAVGSSGSTYLVHSMYLTWHNPAPIKNIFSVELRYTGI